jgi:hypothetical protein
MILTYEPRIGLSLAFGNAGFFLIAAVAVRSEPDTKFTIVARASDCTSLPHVKSLGQIDCTGHGILYITSSNVCAKFPAADHAAGSDHVIVILLDISIQQRQQQHRYGSLS